MSKRESEPSAAVPVLSPDAVIERLEGAMGAEPERLVAFDADGTIWDVDVGVSIFEALLDCGGVRPEAEEALCEDARRFNIPLPPGVLAGRGGHDRPLGAPVAPRGRADPPCVPEAR
jgi:hypothetical protein